MNQIFNTNMSSIPIYRRCFHIDRFKSVDGRMQVILALPLLFILLWGSVAQADFKTGLLAYENEDFETAAREWMPLADAGHMHALYNLGWMYKKGEGVARSDKIAIKLLELAAMQGHAGAQSVLGYIYYYGEGTTRNQMVGARWFTLAAKQGNLRARSELEYMTYKGVGLAHGHQSLADDLAGMIGSAFLFMFNPFAWMLVVYLTLKNKSFGQISVASIGMQVFCVLPFVIYFLLEFKRQEYPTQSDWDAGILELGVLSFISIISGLVISVLVYGLLKRKRIEKSKKPIGTLEPLNEI